MLGVYFWILLSLMLLMVAPDSWDARIAIARPRNPKPGR